MIVALPIVAIGSVAKHFQIILLSFEPTLKKEGIKYIDSSTFATLRRAVATSEAVIVLSKVNESAISVLWGITQLMKVFDASMRCVT